jgi:choline dehydrogenase
LTTGYDYIVIGAGSAGAVLAARLSERADRTVLMLEAGGGDWSPAIHIPGLLGHMLTSTTQNWQYRGRPDATLGGRVLTWMGGRLLGGSSSINGMVYGRGLPHDYARWVAAGNPGWSWDDLLPYFKRAECWSGKPDATRGTKGPLHTRPFTEPHPACTSAIEALTRGGVPFVADYSTGVDEGVGYTQATQHGGWRHSVSRAYLAPNRKRPNLTILTGKHVTRLIVEAGRCVGVEYRSGNRTVSVQANREVIVSAGAIGSPAILLRSGIGDPAELQALGITPVHNLPGVGRNLNEHVNVKISADVDVKTYNTERLGWGKVRNGLRWLIDRKGPAASPANHGQAFVKTDPALSSADVQIQIMAFAFHDDATDNHDGVSAIVSLCAPRVRGTVSLASADPMVPPNIDIELLSDSEDLATLIKGCRIARSALEAGLGHAFGGRIVFPPLETDSDADWTAFIARTAGLNWHPTSTCRMGSDPDDVVDSELRVHGLKGLTICDASVFPSVTSGNTNAPVIAVAEKAADLISARNS